jgi:hypothetical protein
MSAGDHHIAIGEVCRQVSPLSDRATLTGVPTPRDHVNVLPPLVQPACLITASAERQQGNSVFALFVQRDSPELGIPGVGPVLASALVASVPDPAMFKSGRNLAAWIGLVPRQNSSGGKERLGGITKQGNPYLRQMLVVGSLAVIRYAERHGTRRPWLVKLMARRATEVAAIALANQTPVVSVTGNRNCVPPEPSGV